MKLLLILLVICSCANAGFPHPIYKPASATTNAILYFTSTAGNKVSGIAPGTSGNILTSNGTSWISAAGSAASANVFSFNFGNAITTSCASATCGYLDQIGSSVTSVTRSAVGVYSVNFSTTYTKVKCSSNMTYNGNATSSTTPMSCASCSSLSFSTKNYDGTTAVDSYGAVVCNYSP